MINQINEILLFLLSFLFFPFFCCLELLYQGPVVRAATEPDTENPVSPLDGTVSSVTASKRFGLCDPPPSINYRDHYVFMDTDTFRKRKEERFKGL